MTDIMPYIYADNAATTPLSPRALEAMAAIALALFWFFVLR